MVSTVLYHKFASSFTLHLNASSIIKTQSSYMAQAEVVVVNLYILHGKCKVNWVHGLPYLNPKPVQRVTNGA